MKNKLIKLFLCASLFASLLVLLSPAPSLASESGLPGNSDIVFAVHMPPSLLGRGASDVWSDLLMFASAAEKNYGLKISFIKTATPSKTVEALAKGDASAAMINPYYYAREKHYHNLKFSPIAIYQANGSNASRSCIYSIPSEDGTIPDMDSLFGKRNILAFTGEHDWVLLNIVFKGMDYAFEPHFFFSGFSINNSESAAMSMLFDTSQSVLMNELLMKYMIKMDERLGKAVPISCTEPLPNIMIAVADSLPVQSREKLILILTTMNDDKNFDFLKEYFLTSNGKWVPAVESDFIPWEEAYNLSARMGWDKTYNVLPVK